ncbi:MAG: UDPGP type 1 family protein [Lachnospiraceae bacterium]|jgi:UDP-N-acetylglucosamine/UDP-N-acetylgalactosamine diphosphorylase|nr:UDPGP type 1 family protein [Lachnospiraceae bacterium]
MNAIEKVKKYGQEQLLKYVDEISPAEADKLKAQIEELDFDVLSALSNSNEVLKRGKITPLESLELSEIEKHKDEYEKAGIEALKAGKVAAVLLAGGMGTRLGSDAPKGVFNIGKTRDLYIFECLINNMMKVVDRIGRYIRLYVMTSDLNYEATVSFFNEKNFFGYPKDQVIFFKQAMAPCCDMNGKVFLESKSKVSTSPNGNGGWFLSMIRSKVIDDVKKNGIEWFNVFAVDNVLQYICDPVFIGATILNKRDIGAKVVRKNHPDEKVGVVCLEDGRPSIVEYYELTDSMRDEVDERGERVYNFGVILNYLFNVSSLEEIVKTSLPYHVVDKKIPYIDENGNPVKPEEPNGHKFEQLVLDMIHMSDSCLPFEVVREKEFAPIKNKTGIDSVESAQALLEKNGVTL